MLAGSAHGLDEFKLVCGHPHLTEVYHLIDFCRRDILEMYLLICDCSQAAAANNYCILTVVSFTVIIYNLPG